MQSVIFIAMGLQWGKFHNGFSLLPNILSIIGCYVYGSGLLS